MKSLTLRLKVAILVAGLLTAGSLIPASASAPALAMEQGARLVRLTTAETSVLQTAIAEEYLALNTYNAVLKQYPSMVPFANIVLSEQQHVNALAGLFTKYGLAIPGNPGTTAGSYWSTRKAACQTGVEVEVDDIALYDRLIPTMTKADIVRVFSNLRSASLYSHLPAFEACN